jgi:hypothetical protein
VGKPYASGLQNLATSGSGICRDQNCHLDYVGVVALYNSLGKNVAVNLVVTFEHPGTFFILVPFLLKK